MDESVSSIKEIAFELLALGFLLYFSNFFSSSETALTSMSRVKIKEFLETEESSEEKETYIHTSNKLLTTILIANNIVNILASSLATILFISLMGNKELAALMATIVMSTLILIFGEITPKIYAKENPEKVFNFTIKLVRILSKVFHPVIITLMAISNMMIRFFGGKAMTEAPFITEEDIVSLVQVGEEIGTIEQEEEQIIRRAFQMKETSVKEIMTPRVEIVAVEDEASVKDLMELIREEGYSRIPVYRETIDNIIGVCYVKDVITLMEERGYDIVGNMKVKEIMRETIYIPETMKISELLRHFKLKKVHMAIVVDEYGGTAGLVTLEDILEELFGEIMDEYDYDEIIGIKRVGSNTYIVDAMTPINDIERELNIEFPKTDYETIAGYLLELFQRIPSVGEEIEVNGFYFRILAAGRNRIEKVLMRIEKGEKRDVREGTDRKSEEG